MRWKDTQKPIKLNALLLSLTASVTTRGYSLLLRKSFTQIDVIFHKIKTCIKHIIYDIQYYNYKMHYYQTKNKQTK